MLQRLITETLGTALEARSGRVTARAVSPVSMLQRSFVKGKMIGAVKA